MPDTSPHLPREITLVEIRFNSSLSILDMIQPITNKVCDQLGFDEDSQYWIWLATQEALNNAIKHGNKFDPNKKVLFGLQVDQGEFRIVVQDEGEGFNVQEVPDPTRKENLLKTSGRGIFYMRSFMDRVEYNTENGTKVTLVKRQKETDEEA
ncbi:ATP-binding protein [Sulfidibacter corallicola]|uniref:ATP-binding protein n=1 Tax=Sulfidibacter corallicola TaxID=2818388 RepID=A0A8A4TP90_SULCO|nr:ATP-binding protein [Sulfidibacter corallicola]QTD51786.1 ATP-binding protein [Sulfidibacter corallicola]